MIEEIKEAFEQFEFCLNFEIFDPRELPQSKVIKCHTEMNNWHNYLYTICFENR